MVQELQCPPAIGSGPLRPPQLGRVWYVDVGGTDAVERGRSPEVPLASVTYALTLAGAHDYIVLMNNTSANEASFPIVIDVEMIHIIGFWGAPWPNPTLQSDAGNAVFRLAANWIEIGGIDLACADVNSALIDTPGTPQTLGYWWIHHCGFAADGALGEDGILITATDDAPHCVIEDNNFRGDIPAVGNGLARDGIRMEGNMTRSIIRRNIFRHLDGIGIHCIVNGGDIAEISDNKFFTPDLATGEAITMELGCGRALITGNQSAGEDNAVGFCPYRDLSSPGAGLALNAWGINYADITPTLPVIV